MIITRRSFLTGMIAAPLVVRAGVLMPVRRVVGPARFVTEFPFGCAAIKCEGQHALWDKLGDGLIAEWGSPSALSRVFNA